MFIHSYYVLQIHSHILISKDIVSIFPTSLRSMFLLKKALLDNCTVTLKVIEQQHDICERKVINNVKSCTKCSLHQNLLNLIWPLLFVQTYLNVSMLFSGTLLRIIPNSTNGLGPFFLTIYIGIGDEYKAVWK